MQKHLVWWTQQQLDATLCILYLIWHQLLTVVRSSRLKCLLQQQLLVKCLASRRSDLITPRGSLARRLWGAMRKKYEEPSSLQVDAGIRLFKHNHPRGCVLRWRWAEHVPCKSAQHQLTSPISLAGSPHLCWLWMSTRWTGPVCSSSAWRMEMKGSLTTQLPEGFLQWLTSFPHFLSLYCRPSDPTAP